MTGRRCPERKVLFTFSISFLIFILNQPKHINMKILKKIIIWLIVLIALLVVVAYLLPKTYHVERSALIKAEKQIVFDMVCDFEKWDLWTPWTADSDSTAIIEYIGNCEVGALQRWDGEEIKIIRKEVS